MTDIVKELCATKCNREPFTPSHAECQCLKANKAAYEIQRLRDENQRYRIALLGICRPVWSRPPIDSEAANTYAHICQEMITIAQFALAATTANTAANTSDAVTNETDATL